MYLSPLWRVCSTNVPAEPFAVMPSTGSHEQAVSGRQAGSSSSNGPSYLGKIFFFFLIRSLKLTPPFSALLLPLLRCGRPPSRWATHTCLPTSTASPPSPCFSLTDVSMRADGRSGSRQPATQPSLALSIFTVVWSSSSCQAWPQLKRQRTANALQHSPSPSLSFSHVT